MRAHPALVLNADFQPLNYFPLSTMDWETAVKNVYEGNLSVVAEYETVVRSPSTTMWLPMSRTGCHALVVAIEVMVAVSPGFTMTTAFLSAEQLCCMVMASLAYSPPMTISACPHTILRAACARVRQAWEASGVAPLLLSFPLLDT